MVGIVRVDGDRHDVATPDDGAVGTDPDVLAGTRLGARFVGPGCQHAAQDGEEQEETEGERPGVPWERDVHQWCGLSSDEGDPVTISLLRRPDDVRVCRGPVQPAGRPAG